MRTPYACVYRSTGGSKMAPILYRQCRSDTPFPWSHVLQRFRAHARRSAIDWILQICPVSRKVRRFSRSLIRIKVFPISLFSWDFYVWSWDFSLIFALAPNVKLNFNLEFRRVFHLQEAVELFFVFVSLIPPEKLMCGGKSLKTFFFSAFVYMLGRA